MMKQEADLLIARCKVSAKAGESIATKDVLVLLEEIEMKDFFNRATY